MIVRGDGFVVLRGSIGTLAELGIVWNLASLEPGFHKPIVLLGDSWKNVIRAYEEHLAVGAEQTRFITSASSPEQCVQLLKRKLGLVQSSFPENGGPLPHVPFDP